jgi:hypothetical protein
MDHDISDIFWDLRARIEQFFTPSQPNTMDIRLFVEHLTLLPFHIHKLTDNNEENCEGLLKIRKIFNMPNVDIPYFIILLTFGN